MTATEQPPAPDLDQDARRECPYIGLQPYGESDSDYFFGRGADRDLIIANLMASRLTVLYGPSGVGKSSLLQAGVLPLLRHGSDDAFSFIASSRAIVAYHASWRDDPLAALGHSLRAALPTDTERDGLMSSDPLSVDLLREVTRRYDADLYLLCDGLEEWALYQDGAKAEAFASELGRIVETPGLRVNVLLGVREDALAKLDRLEAYIPDLFRNGLRLDHLTAAGARDAIEKPLLRHNQAHPSHSIALESSLVDRLLRELRTGRVVVTDGRGASGAPDKTIETPFLQLVMTRLWSAEKAQESAVLRESTLVSLGGASRIVRTHLDEVMAQLTDEQRATAAQVFRYLVTPSGTKIAHTAEDLAEYAGISDMTQLVDMLEELASGRERVLRPVPPPVEHPGPPRYEIFHDVMAPAILDWRRRYVAEQDRLKAEAVLVQTRQEAEERHRRTKRRLRRSRLLSAALALLLAAAIAAVVYAKRSSDDAVAGRRLADFERLLPSDPAAALHAALGAWHKRNSPTAEAAVRTALDADNRLQVLSGHSGIVWTSQFAPDGKTVLTAGSDGTARIFDAAGQHPARILTPADHSRSPVQAASFSQDGSMVATAENDGSVRVYSADGQPIDVLTTLRRQAQAVWTTQHGRQLLLVSTASDEVEPAVLWDPKQNVQLVHYGDQKTGAIMASLSRDGSEVVAADNAGSLTVWDTGSGRQLAHSESMGSAAFPHFVTPSSGRIAALASGSGTDWELKLWDWRTPSAVVTGSSSKARFPVDLAVSNDGKRIAMVNDKFVLFFDATSDGYASASGYTAEQPAGINGAEFSADGQWLLTAGVDGRSQVWAATAFDGRPVAEFSGHRGEIFSAQFDPVDPTQVTTASVDGTARIWKFNSAKLLRPAGGGWVMDAEFSSDGTHIVTAEDTGDVQIWNAATGRAGPMWNTYSPGFLVSAQFVANDDRIVTATRYSYAPELWDWTTQEHLVELTHEDQWISSGATVNQDGTQVAVGDSYNRVVEWDLHSGKIVGKSTSSHNGWFITSVAYVPNSNMIAAASDDGSVRIWESTHLEGPAVRTLGQAGSTAVLALAASPDGTRIVSVDGGHVIRIWRVADGQLERQIEGPSTTMSAVTFSPDGHLIAVAAADATVHVWDAKSGNPIATIQRHGDMVNSVRFATGGGIRLLTGSDDSTSAIFACQTCESFSKVLAEAEQRDRRP